MAKKKIAEQGDKITQESCPSCHDEVVVEMKDGNSEVFECEDCDFKINKKKK